MDTAVRKISIHSVDLGQVTRTAYRAHIHLQFLVTAVITVCQRKIDTFIISQIHCSADQGTDCFFIIANRITYILDLTTITEFPESSLQILFLDWSYILCYMAVEAVADIRSVRNALNDSVHFTELLYLQTTETFCRCAVNRIQISVFLLKLIYLIIDIFQYFQSKLSIFTNRLTIIQLLQFIQRCDSKGSSHRF